MHSLVLERLRRWQFRRAGQRTALRASFTGEELHGMGLRGLVGTVQYPTQATPRRSSGSRVAENGTHGFKGAYMETGPLSRR
jgi:hypothetical protein